jgi:DNA-binding NarL/FixJ family response regulator
MPGVQGFSGLVFLRAQHPDIPVVIVSANEDTVVIRRALEFGASGFIPKSLESEEIGLAIQAVLAGDSWTPPDAELGPAEDGEIADLMRRLATLTPQQVRVLMMLSEGLLNKQIAYELSVSEATVKAHVSAVLQSSASKPDPGGHRHPPASERRSGRPPQAIRRCARPAPRLSPGRRLAMKRPTLPGPQP